MEPLLSLYLRVQHTATGLRPSDNSDVTPSFLILHDGRFQALDGSLKTYHASELSITELPCPHLNLIWYYLTTKDGSYLGYAVQHMNKTDGHE
ncbi:hypothetical protein [Sediminibacterium sp.]|uniref:hypothetical protein n=1 Tax=Sediminibacterium sp. TaxID=1917865 RepID=UPI003F69F5C1